MQARSTCSLMSSCRTVHEEGLKIASALSWSIKGSFTCSRGGGETSPRCFVLQSPTSFVESTTLIWGQRLLQSPCLADCSRSTMQTCSLLYGMCQFGYDNIVGTHLEQGLGQWLEHPLERSGNEVEHEEVNFVLKKHALCPGLHNAWDQPLQDAVKPGRSISSKEPLPGAHHDGEPGRCPKSWQH